MASLFGFSDRQSRTKLGQIYLDVLISEDIEMEAEVTQYPVEDGTVISDHITQGAERIRISGLVSTADVVALSFTAGGGAKMVDAIEALRSMHQARALVSVSTGKMLYEDFAFTQMRASRSSGGNGGNWLQIDADLIKVRKTKLKTAEVPEAPARGPARGRAGQTQQPAGRVSSSSSGTTSDRVSNSALKGVLNYLRGS